MFEDLKRKLAAGLDKLWVRIVVIAFLSLVAAFVARALRPIIPDGFATTVGSDAVDDLLKIIASSMLAVVTFSLSVMVTVYHNASAQWTPRVRQLMLEDRTTQNTLATFVGAFIFALASIVLLRTSVYVDESSDNNPVVVLFFFTILVLVMIVVAIVRWILHLQKVGSLMDVAHRIERDARNALESRLAEPFLGGRPLADPRVVPLDAYPVTSESTGYVQAVFKGAMSDAADEGDIDVYLDVPIGHFVHRGQTLCHLSREDDDMIAMVRRNIVIGEVRTFEQDPRFGVVVLGEVASKALSPGINDPGTAIDVIGRIVRVIECYRSEMSTDSADVIHAHLWVPPLLPHDLLEDGFDPIARDGAGIIEVQIVLQAALASLAEHSEPSLVDAARACALRSFYKAIVQLDDADADRLRAAVPDHVRDAVASS